MNSLYQIIPEVAIQSTTTNGRKKLLCRVVSLFVCALFIGIIQLNAQRTYTWTGASNGNWNNTLNWGQSPGGGTFPGNIESNDIVIIPNNGSNAPVVNATPNNAIASLTFTGASSNPQLTINNLITLTVTGAVTLNSVNANRVYTITGPGTLSCGSFTLGTSQIVGGNRLTTLTHTQTNIIVQNNFTIATYRQNTLYINCTYTHTSGSLTINGTFITSLLGSGSAIPTANYAMGNSNPELNLNGSTAMTLSPSIINTMDFVGTGATVAYQSSSNVSLPVNVTGPPATTGVTTYTNLTIGGGNGSIKTVGANMTVSGVLTVAAETTLSLGTFTMGTLSSLVVETFGGGFGSNIAGSGLITLGGNIAVNYKGTGDIVFGASIANPIQLFGATRTIQVEDDGNLTNADLTINGVISSNDITPPGYGITKTDAGKLVLTASNSFRGPVTISAGILSGNTMANAATNSAFGSGSYTNTISIAAAGTLEYTGTGHTTGRPIDLLGSGATIAASGSGLLTMNGMVTGATYGIIFTGTGTGLYSGIIGTTTGTVTKSGTGTWKLSGGGSTYTGVTTISGGTLLIGANVAVSTNGPLGNSSTAVVLGDVATTTNNWSPTLLLDGAFSFARDITIADRATSGVYSIGGNTDNNASISGNITFNRSFSITQVATTSTNALTISGSIAATAGTKTITFNNVGTVIKSTNAIANGIGSVAVVKNNSGALTMSVANTYGLSTTLNAGTLNINNAAALGNALAVFTINGGTIQNTTGGPITTNNYQINWGSSFTFSGSQPLNLGTGTVNGSGNIQITTTTAAVALTFGGSINPNDAELSLIKEGAGNFNLVSQSVILKGLTINAGSFTASSGTTTIDGVFTNNATYVHNNGTVIMSTNSSSIINTTTLTFNHLTIATTPTSQNQYSHGFSVAGTLTINGGVTFAPPAATITMSSAASAITNNGSCTFNNLSIAVTPNAPSQYNTSFSVAGVFNLLAGTFAPTDGTITMSSAGSSITNGGVITFNNLTIAATPAVQSQYEVSFSMRRTLTVNAGVSFTSPSGSTITMSHATSAISNAGTLLAFHNLTIAATPNDQSQYNTSFSVNGALAINGGVTFAPTGGTITMSSIGSSITNGGTLSFQNLIIAATPNDPSQYNTSFNVAAGLTINGSVTFAPSGGTITMNDAASSIVNNGTLTFYNLTISATPNLPSQYGTSYAVASTLTISGAITFAPTSGTVNMSGGVGLISNASGDVTFNNLTISGSSVSSTGNFAVANTMSVTGEFNPDATSVISGAGTLTGTGTVNVTRIAATPSFGGQYTISNKTLADLTVDYNGAGAQTVSAADYGTLVISTNGTRTVTFENGGTVRVSNVFTPTASNTTYVVIGNIFEYNGSGSQTITAFTYNDLILSNTASKAVLAGTAVNCQTLTINGNIFLILPDTSLLNVLANL